MSPGSHSTWSPGDSRTCIHCGQPLRITGQQALWIHTEAGEHTSSHAKCGPPWKPNPKEHTMSDTETTTTTTTTETTVDPQPQPTPPDQPEPDDDEDDEE